MRFLCIQITIVILVCIFIAALSNLTELGAVGWIVAGSAGYTLHKIYRHMHKSLKTKVSKERCLFCDPDESELSGQLHSFMFDDATGLGDE